MKACEKAAQLLSESMDGKLSIRKKISLVVHLGICKVCRIYESQINFIRDLTIIYKRKIEESNNMPGNLSMHVRERIKRALKDNSLLF
jgi:hypothetical protein